MARTSPGNAWDRLETETVFRCPYYTLEHDRYRLPGGGIHDYHYVHTGGSSVVIPVLPDGRLVLVRQFRYLFQRESLEFPRGGIRPGEDPAAIAAKELVEEAGLRARSLRELGRFVPYNGVSDETCYVFVARDLRETAGHPEETEAIEREIHPLARVQSLARRRAIWDGMTLAALYQYLLGGPVRPVPRRTRDAPPRRERIRPRPRGR